MIFTKALVPNTYRFDRISFTKAARYIKAFHYSKGCHNGASPCYGILKGDRLVGVIMFAVSCSENVRRSVFGPGTENRVIELHRLHLLDEVPKNAESWFLGQAFKRVIEDLPQTRAVITFSDPSAGHTGTIYQAANALYAGRTKARTFYLDETGRLRHPRQNGVNITLAMAAERGWEPTRREGKYRYVFLVGNRADRRYWLRKLRLTTHPYPARLLFKALSFAQTVGFIIGTYLPEKKYNGNKNQTPYRRSKTPDTHNLLDRAGWR